MDFSVNRLTAARTHCCRPAGSYTSVQLNNHWVLLSLAWPESLTAIKMRSDSYNYEAAGGNRHWPRCFIWTGQISG